MAESFEAWWGSLGIITKFCLIVSVLCTCGFSFQIVPPQYLLIDLSATLWQLQLWRPLTATLFLGKFGFPWLMAIAMLVMNLRRHEDEDFVGRKGDMVWMMVILVAVLHVLAIVMGMMIVSFAFTMAIVWVWCKRHPDAQLSIQIFAFKAIYFPWALMGFHLLMNMSIVDDIVGIVAGHVYVLLADILPRTHDIHLIKTPAFIQNYFGTMGAPSWQRGHLPRDQPQEQRHRWGGGRTLGAN